MIGDPTGPLQAWALPLVLLSAAWATDARAQVVLAPLHYDLNVEVDHEGELLRGTARIVVENPSAQRVDVASLLLYRLLRVRSVHGDAGDGLSFDQDVVAFEDFPKLQVNHLLVTLAEPLAPGQRTALGIEYEGHLLGYAETGMRYIQDRIDPAFTILRDDAYAYPQPGYPSNAVNRGVPMPSFTYAARIAVDSGLVVANGGRLEGIDSTGDRVTYRYASLEPSWRMDFAIADYTRLSAGSIHVFHLPGSKEGAAGVAGAARTALDLFSEWFGPLPDAAALTFIEIPDGWGSQADVTTIIQTSAAFRDPRRHREVYHEISHLWNPAPTDRPAPRWEEGLASFLEYLVTEEVTGRPVVDMRAEQLVEWLRDQLPGRPAWREVPMIDYGRNRLTDLSYSVGALFFDLLYRAVGRDTFNEIVARYVADFRATGGSTTDLVDVVRATGGKDLTRLVDDWIHTTAWVERIEAGTTVAELAEHYRGAAPVLQEATPAGCAATPDPDMLSAQVPVDVAVEFDPRDSLQAAAIETMAANAVRDIESFFERPFRESIIVNVLPDRAAFDEYFRSAWGIPATECWMVGAASSRGLVLLSPRVWLDQACEHDPRDRDHVGGIVAHELVHVLHGQYNPTEDFEGMDPLGWFVEGVAVLASGQLDARRGDAMEAMRAGALPTQLASVWSGRFRYGLAGSLVEYVDRTYGRAMVRRLLAATTQRQALDMLGVTEHQLLESWKSSLSWS